MIGREPDRSSAGLRADQLDRWADAVADSYGPPASTRPADPADLDSGWVAEATRAIERARQDHPNGGTA